MGPKRLPTHRVGVEKFAEQGGQGSQLFVVSLTARDDHASLLESCAGVIERTPGLSRSYQEKQDHQRDRQVAHQSRSSIPVTWRNRFSRLSGAILRRTF